MNEDSEIEFIKPESRVIENQTSLGEVWVKLSNTAFYIHYNRHVTSWPAPKGKGSLILF